MNMEWKLYVGNLKPSIKEHRKAKSPYLSIYGEILEERIRLYYSMSKFYCIINLIWFMMKEAEKLMKGSVYEDNFFIAHDTLVLMTEKATIT